MTEERFDCIIDASVGIKLFLVEPLSDRTDALFAHLTDDPPSQFYVPDLFFIECTNILWKYVQRFGYSSDAARQNVADLARLPLQTISTAVLVEVALDPGEAVRAEARELVEHWSTPEGGFIVFNYGDSGGIGTSDHIADVMFKTFYDLREYWVQG